jgi:catechol 2,3-dioxygenase-like lactoylglutathione lyase family enzyme
MIKNKLHRVGTSYIPVADPKKSSEWYSHKLGAEIAYLDKDKAILNFANQSFFLVKAANEATSNFMDIEGNIRFPMTFEVNGLEELTQLNKEFKELGVVVGEIEDRGHTGNNFIFEDLDGNRFDVWSELSPTFKEKYGIE